MAELLPGERLQPSLLDRLTDDEPDKPQESRERRVLSMRHLRESVRRDLAWLFNATNLDTAQSLENYPQVARSVLNYGLPELAGHAVTSLDLPRIEQQLKNAILAFEPRVLRNSLKVTLHASADRMNINAVAFEIEGELWGQPLPEQLYLRTEIDLELGEVHIIDYNAR